MMAIQLVPPDGRFEDWDDAANETASGTMPTVPMLFGPDIAQPLPDLEYLLAEMGLVAGGGAPHLVAGYGFSGKTLALQSMALSLAAGSQVWGAYTARDQRRVVHVDLEQGERLTRRRYQRLARAAGVELSALGDRLGLAVMPPALTLGIACEDRWKAIMSGRDLCIIDSLRAASSGQDENDSGIRDGLDVLGRVSEATGCRAVVVHHARKTGPDDPGGRYAIRGSSAIFDGVDSAYLFTAAKGEPVKVEQVKSRSHGEPIDDFALVIRDVEIDGDPKGGVSCEVRGAELVTERREAAADLARHARSAKDAETVRKALQKQPGLGSRELRGACGMSGDRIAAAIASLGGEVEVREEKAGRGVFRRHFLHARGAR